MCLADPASSSRSLPASATGGGSGPAQGGTKTPRAGGAERFLADLGRASVVEGWLSKAVVCGGKTFGRI